MSIREQVECLESRRLLSALISNGVLIVSGTESRDAIELKRIGSTQLRVTIWTGASSTPTSQQTFSTSAFQSTRVFGLGGNDKIYVADNATIPNLLLQGGAGRGDTLLARSGRFVDGETIRDGAGTLVADYFDGPVEYFVHGTPGADRISWSLKNGDDVVTINSSFSGSLFRTDGQPHLSGVEGGAGNDTIVVSGTGSDTVNGGAGNDNITSGVGNDLLTGGDGNDTINGSSGNNNVDGGTGNDSITTTTGTDTVAGGDGNDTLAAGAGADVITGGLGNDLFNFASGDSGTTLGALDQIRDWSSTDSLDFTGIGPATGTNYLETTATDYASAKAFADAQISGGIVDYVVVQVGGDLVVFADNANNNVASDDAVVLVGKTLNDIDFTNIV
jgi:Ca2+-binding RTX toxin-like protein